MGVVVNVDRMLASMLKRLSVRQWCHRSTQLRDTYVPFLRERHPEGAIVMINLLTAEYVVGESGEETMELFAEKFGEVDWCLDTVHPVIERRRGRCR